MDTPPRKRRKKLKPELKRYTDPTYQWAVYFAVDGVRKRSLFKTRKEAASFLADKEVEAENLGATIASTVDDKLKRDAYAATKLLQPYGKSLTDAAQHYCRYLEMTAKSETLVQAAEDFILAMEKAGKAHRYILDLRSRLTAFVETRPDSMCAEVVTPQVIEWLSGLKVGNTTRNHYRRVLSAFFTWCERMGFCAENPVSRVDKGKAEPTAIAIYSPKEFRTILGAALKWKPEEADTEEKTAPNKVKLDNGTRDVLANLVLCGFAGLRQAEFERLSWDCVKQDRGVIDLSAALTKTAARRIVKIRPALAAWLNHMKPLGEGRICRKNFDRRNRAFRRHLTDTFKIEWKHNALRHSFASYLMEEMQNPGEVSLQLGHSDAGIVFAHYRELVTAEDTKAFWALTPDAVMKDLPQVIPFQGEKAVGS